MAVEHSMGQDGQSLTLSLWLLLETSIHKVITYQDRGMGIRKISIETEGASTNNKTEA